MKSIRLLYKESIKIDIVVESEINLDVILVTDLKTAEPEVVKSN